MFYEVYGNDEAFEKYYDLNPHLYKRHEKYFKECNDEYLEFANTYHPSDFNDWLSSLDKLFKYEQEMYSKVDKHGDLIIVSYYSLNEVPLSSYYSCKYKSMLTMRFIYNTKTTSMYHYTMKMFRYVAYVLNKCDGKYRMGGYTDMDSFYRQCQIKLDDKSIQVLKSLETFKYLPIEKFTKVSVYKLFQINDNMIYQYEILLKIGSNKLASDLLLNRNFITTEDFKQYKKEIINGMRLQKLNHTIFFNGLTEKERLRYLKSQEEQKKSKEEQRELLRLEKKMKKLDKLEKIELFAKLPKLEFDLGEYVIMHPKTFEDLKHEGKELVHCVADYLERIVMKKTDVFFLRKKEELEKPYFTIELRNGEVIQVRTLDQRTDPLMTNLVKEWSQQISI